MNNMKRLIQGILWIVIYLLLTLAPLFILLIGPTPEGRDFWREFSVALGFTGLAMMGLQFVLTARFKTLKAPYGSDIVYFFHRQISVVTFFLILAHPVILFITTPSMLSLLNPLSAPWRARFGLISILSLIGLVGFSVYRKQLKVLYERWRIWHGIFAISAMLGALFHILGVNHYVAIPWKKAFWIAYTAFWVGLILWTRLIKPWLEMRNPYRIVQVTPERGNAATLTIQPNHHRGIRFQPGQFAWISVGANPYMDREHPFSIASSAEKPEQISFTIKNLGDFSSTIPSLKLGETVYLDGPYGSFSIDRHQHASGFVFLAGGIGITPFMSTLRTIRDRKDTRPVWLFYANNEWEDVTFREELEAIQSAINLHLIHIIRFPGEGYQGETGFITREILLKHLPDDIAGLEFFICGPIPMMKAAEGILSDMNIAPGDIHTEVFYLA